MAKDPAFLFYYQDFLVGVDPFTNEEIGAYIKCLCHQAHKGIISEKHMKNICNSLDVYNNIKIKFITDTNGDLYNEKLRNVINQRKMFTESRRKNRKGKTKENICGTSVSHMENEIENENIKEDLKEKEKEEKPKSSSPSPIILYKLFLEHNIKLPKPLAFLKERKDKCSTRLKDPNFVKNFTPAVQKAQTSPFLCGKNDRGWKATFDWFIANETNIFKVLEGKYDDNTSLDREQILVPTISGEIAEKVRIMSERRKRRLESEEKKS